MESLDEFVQLESAIQKAEDSFLKPHRKKQWSDILNMETDNLSDNSINLSDIAKNNNCEFEELLKSVISELRGNQHRDYVPGELIKKLCKRLKYVLDRFYEYKQAEPWLAQDIDELRLELHELSSSMYLKKDSMTTTHNGDSRVDSSLEVARRHSNHHSSNMVSELDPSNHQCDKTQLVNGTNGTHHSTDEAKLMLDQAKLFEKIDSERQHFKQECEHKNREIEELKAELKRVTNNSSRSNTSRLASSSNSNGSLFDWPVEESACDQPLLANGNEFTDSSTAYSSIQNNRYLHVLSDIVKAFLETEDEIQRQLVSMGFESNKCKSDEHQLGFPSLDAEERLSEITFDFEDGIDLTPSSMNVSNHSTNNDIEYDVVLGAKRRLQLAVERVLKILADFSDRNSQLNLKELLKQKEDMALELQEEGHRRDKLTRQLLDTEKALHTLECDKKRLVEQLIDYQEVKNQHEQVKMKLEEYERDRDKFLHENRRLETDKSTFSQGLPQLQQKLLQENETLNHDIRQLQHDKLALINKINGLTAEVENLKSEKDQIIETKNAEFEELISQIDSSEKNLNSLKRFVEEQTQDRECEREEFNKEVSGLREKLKDKDKLETKLKSSIRSLESQVTMLGEEKSLQEERVGELSSRLKEANMKISEMNLTVRQLESELERNNQIEAELRKKMRELSTTLDIKLSEETNWEDLANAILQFLNSKDSQESKNKVATRTVEVQNDIASITDSSDSIFLTVKLMDDKIRELNVLIDDLLAQKNNLEKDVAEKNSTIESYKPQIESLEKSLEEKGKANELLQQEINVNHMKYSELKVKLDSSVDVNEFRKVVGELQAKLSGEKKQNEALEVRLEQANRHAIELGEKLDAYKKEIKSYKELLKSHEHDPKVVAKESFEMSQLHAKLASREKTIAILEQNVDILKSKLSALTEEKNIYLEQLQSYDDTKNKITLYEKNLEKLRLQNKISSDKIIYLDLEIRNLKKKIEILEKENELLKIQNQKLVKQKQEINQAMIEFEDQVDGNANQNQIYLSGLDKMNNISSNNLLMLKVRRLLTQKGALIYQKNYLIHVLGSYQRTENDTLALLANFNNSKELDEDEIQMRGKPRFRSVAYALIAISRMRFMVNLWQCRKRQLLFTKTARSISNLQNVPLPPKKFPSSSKNSPTISPTLSDSPRHQKHPLSASINSSLKDYIDRLHMVHETLGLQTNKL